MINLKGYLEFGFMSNMCLFGKNKGEEKMDSFWIKTNYGYAPKDAVKVHFTPERDEYPKVAGSPGEAFALAQERLRDIHQKLEYLESRIYDAKELLRGRCINCKKNFLIPAKQKPIFFKCPFCSPDDEKRLIELLLFLNPNNEIFSNCPGCNKYTFIIVNEQPKYFSFQCKACNNEFLLRKDHEINLENHSDKTLLLWCSACGYIFENPLDDNYPEKCPRCESQFGSKF